VTLSPRLLSSHQPNELLAGEAYALSRAVSKTDLAVERLLEGIADDRAPDLSLADCGVAVSLGVVGEKSGPAFPLLAMLRRTPSHGPPLRLAVENDALKGARLIVRLLTFTNS
jgi:hypothetical protein